MADGGSKSALKILSRFSKGTSALAVGFGVMVLTGWAFHIQRLKGLLPGQVAVKANTAVCFILIGMSVWLVLSGLRSRLAQGISSALCLMASLVGLLSFLEYWKSWDFGIDQLLFKAGADDLPGSVRLALMSPIAAADFFLLGIAIALFNIKGRWPRVLQSSLATVAAVASIFGILDFVLEPRSSHTHIAPLTALILWLISLVVLCARTDWGLGALLVSDTAGGLLCRRLLPSAILVPIVIAWLRWKGQQVGLYPEWTGLAIMTVSAGALLAGLTAWTAFVLDRSEARRRRAEESALGLAGIVTSSNDGIIGKTLDGIVTSWNPGATTIYGYSAQEMIGQNFKRVVPPDLHAEFEHFLLRLRHGESISSYETERMRKDGRRISVSITVSPLRDAKGNIVGAATITRDITERKRTEQALAAERRRFETVLDSLPVMVCLLRPDYSVAFANHSFRGQFGEPQGRKCYEFCYGNPAPCEFCRSFEVLKTGRSLDWEVITNDGKAIHAFVFPFTDTDGSPLILEMDLDVTARKEADRKLQAASRYTRSLIEASLDPLVTISKEGKITDVNEATEKATGISRDRLIGSDFSDYFTEPQKAREGYQRVFEKGFVRDYPLAIRSASGAVTDVLYNATVFKGASGEVDGVFAAARDVTERKRAEAEIRQLNRDLEQRVEQRTAQLRESETRVRRKLDSILSPEADLGHLELVDILDIPAIQSLLEDFHSVVHVTTALIDLDGKILAVAGWQNICSHFHRINAESCKNCIESDQQLSTGIAEGEFKIYKCSNHMWDVATPILIGGQHLGNLFCGQFFFEDESVDYEVFRAQAKHYGFDEKEYIAALDVVPRLSREAVNASMTFLARLARMISQLSYSGIKLARSTEQTSRVNSELAAANKELEAFTYSVSHDLRAPLRHISGFSKILSEEFSESLPPEAQHHVQRIQEGTRRMGQLVDDLLNLGRVGRKELSLQVAGIRSIVEEVQNNLKSEIGDRKVEWRIGDLPYVECDTSLIHQVFQNLLSNALKFTRPRSLAVIEIGQEQRNGDSVVFVRDNGVGFSMKYADKLFGVFQRLHRQEDFEGTGVGLATVQRIIQKHGGRIWAEAELDKGASFYFTLGTSETSEDKTKVMAVGDNHA